jgi:hypothetical protein
MKNNAGLEFWFFSVSLVTLRVADVVITYIVSPDLRWEINPLVSVAGLGWLSLITSNVAGVAVILILFHYSLVRGGDLYPTEPGYSVKEFISHYLFGERHSFRKIYYVVPTNRRAIIEYAGYVSIRVLTVWSLIIVVHNALVWYSEAFRGLMSNLKLWLAVYALLIILTVAYSLRFFKVLYLGYSLSHRHNTQ